MGSRVFHFSWVASVPSITHFLLLQLSPIWPPGALPSSQYVLPSPRCSKEEGHLVSPASIPGGYYGVGNVDVGVCVGMFLGPPALEKAVPAMMDASTHLGTIPRVTVFSVSAVSVLNRSFSLLSAFQPWVPVF